MNKYKRNNYKWKKNDIWDNYCSNSLPYSGNNYSRNCILRFIDSCKQCFKKKNSEYCDDDYLYIL